MIIPVTHILPLTTIERRRMLPAAGTVLVRSGQEVSADEIIATAEIYAEHISLDLARGLGVPKKQVNEFLQRKIGEDIQQGAAIASRPGVVARVIRAPKAGKLVAVGGGQALLQVSRKPYQLKAAIPGTVFKVEADYGAIIRMTGSWIQGVWGNGKLGTGGLNVTADSPEHVLEASQLDPSKRGQVVFAGYCASQEALETIGQLKMRGLILGSLSTKLRPMASQMPYPIIILEGFGNIPINAVAYKLLSTSGDRVISLNATPYDRLTGERPEAVMPAKIQTDTPMPRHLIPLEIGSQVHILRDPHPGAVGEVIDLLGPTRMANGLNTEAAEVLLDEEKVIVPLANLEIIG